VNRHLAPLVVLFTVAVALNLLTNEAAADTTVQLNIAGNHTVTGANSPPLPGSSNPFWSGPSTLPAGDAHHLRLLYDRLASAQPEAVSLNEVCISQAVNIIYFLEWVAPNQYHSHFNNAFPGGGAPPACNYAAGGATWTGFGNLIITRSNYEPWVAGGTLFGAPVTGPGEIKTWACVDGGTPSARFTACTSHFWPKNISSGYACSAMSWTRDNLMNPFFSRHSNLAMLGDFYLTRAPNPTPGVDGTINGCTPPGLLSWWKSNFAANGNSDNSRTLGTTDAQVDHIIIDGLHSYSGSARYTHYVLSCPPGTGFEQCNLTDHRLVYANPNV